MKLILCKECGDVVVSDSRIRHQLDRCKCGETSVDLELHYCRIIGKEPELLEQLVLIDIDEYNALLELVDDAKKLAQSSFSFR